MLAKTLLTLGMVAAMSFSMTGAFAQNYGYGNGYRNDHREMRQDRRDFRNDRFDRRDMRGGRGNFERGEHRYGNEHHYGSNSHNFGGGHSFGGNRGRR